MKVPILEHDCTVSAIDIGISHRFMDNQAPKSLHLTAKVYIDFKPDLKKPHLQAESKISSLLRSCISFQLRQCL
jgi:hypothetical protein